jgi:hypothetical protein
MLYFVTGVSSSNEAVNNMASSTCERIEVKPKAIYPPQIFF